MCWTHHGLVIEHHTLTGSHGSGCGSQIGEDEKGLALHLWTFGGDDIDDFAVCGEEGIELRPDLILVDLVIEIVDVEGRNWLRRGHY